MPYQTCRRTALPDLALPHRALGVVHSGREVFRGEEGWGRVFIFGVCPDLPAWQ